MMAVIEHYFLSLRFCCCWFLCLGVVVVVFGGEEEVWVNVLTLYVLVITSCSGGFSIFSFSSRCLGGGGEGRSVC